MRYFVYFGLIIVTLFVNTYGQKLLKHRWNLWVGYGVPIFFMMLFLLTFPGGGLGDFNKAYYSAGSLVIKNSLGLYEKTCRTFVNIPIVAFLFIPFGLTNKFQAQMTFTFIGSLSIFMACLLLIKLTKISEAKQIALIGLFAINGPLYYSLRQGNTTHWLLLLLVAVTFCIYNKREREIGILLAIAALMKPLFLLTGAYFAFRKRWRVTVAFATVLLATVGLSLLTFGLELHSIWLNRCIYPFIGKPTGAFNVQSVDGFLARLLLQNDVNLNNFQPLETTWQFKLLRYSLCSLLLGGSLWICWRSRQPRTPEEENLEFSIFLCLAVLISPISWTHYYLFLLLPLSLYTINKLAIPQGWIWHSLILTSILLISPPVTLIEPQNIVLRLLVSKLIISHYFFGGVLLLSVLLAARWQSSKHSHPSPEILTP